MANTSGYLKIIRNLLIATLSSIWVYFLVGSASFFLHYMKAQEVALAQSQGHDEFFSYIDLSEGFLHLSGYSLMVVIFFWTFIAANKLWPINKQKS